RRGGARQAGEQLGAPFSRKQRQRQQGRQQQPGRLVPQGTVNTERQQGVERQEQRGGSAGPEGERGSREGQPHGEPLVSDKKRRIETRRVVVQQQRVGCGGSLEEHDSQIAEQISETRRLAEPIGVGGADEQPTGKTAEDPGSPAAAQLSCDARYDVAKPLAARQKAEHQRSREAAPDDEKRLLDGDHPGARQEEAEQGDPGAALSEGQSAGEEKRRSHGEVNLLDGVAGVEEE